MELTQTELLDLDDALRAASKYADVHHLTDAQIAAVPESRRAKVAELRDLQLLGIATRAARARARREVREHDARTRAADAAAAREAERRTELTEDLSDIVGAAARAALLGRVPAVHVVRGAELRSSAEQKLREMCRRGGLTCKVLPPAHSDVARQLRGAAGFGAWIEMEPHTPKVPHLEAAALGVGDSVLMSPADARHVTRFMSGMFGRSYDTQDAGDGLARVTRQY